MVAADGRVKVLDFGLAKIAAPSTDEPVGSEMETDLHTREGVVMGTMPYMSPEQIAGRAVDQQTDVFSFGVMLYEMATGRRPFAGQSSAELASAILRDTPPAPAAAPCRSAGRTVASHQPLSRKGARRTFPEHDRPSRRAAEPGSRRRGPDDRPPTRAEAANPCDSRCGRHRDPGGSGGVFRIPAPAVGSTGGREGASDPIDRRAAARQLLRRSEPGLLRRRDDRRAHLGSRTYQPDPGDLARFGDAVRGQQSTVGPRDRRGARCRRHHRGLGAAVRRHGADQRPADRRAGRPAPVVQEFRAQFERRSRAAG